MNFRFGKKSTNSGFGYRIEKFFRIVQKLANFIFVRKLVNFGVAPKSANLYFGKKLIKFNFDLKWNKLHSN